MKNRRLFALTLLIFLLPACSDDPGPVAIRDSDKELPARWADLTLEVIRNSFPNSPTFTSRNLGYIGLTMYESIVHGSPVHKSLVGQLSGLTALPLPENDKTYNWAIALNAGQAFILKNLYAHMQYSALEKVDSLEYAVFAAESATTTLDVAERSRLYGLAVAEAIFEWSKTDGGHEGHMRHWDMNYKFPSGPGYWVPPAFGQTVSPYPLHPHWGSNRTFIPANSQMPVPEMIPYSADPGSEYYKSFEAVYKKRFQLTAEEKRIAAWWADDPTQSASPPGHSYNLATIVVTLKDATMVQAAEAYAKVGMAVADAFICCWKVKYTYHVERPATFIISNIDNTYLQFWPEPPFPAFSSGHSTQSAAAARALISVFGNNIAFVDNTYEDRLSDFEEIEYRSRSFRSVWSTAIECAHSRFLGGIHTQYDNEVGTDQGITIGDNVVALSWTK
ncbi:MAG TPA: vanadium-dependent haloperoxidase [Chryseosolibacter sp.]|nr:vanadium-dependent haloperoxidase [Chryseosolibacter sp.]